MRTDEIKAVIDQVAALIREHYVFPDVGQAVADRLIAAQVAGRYDEVTEPVRLAEQVTADLQVGNGDKHLRLIHHIDELFEEDEDPVAEEAAWVRHVELTAAGMARAERLAGNIGVLAIKPTLYDPKYAGAALAGAMTLLWGTDALLLDLRGCRGGSPEMVALVCSYLLDGEPVHLNDLVTPSTGAVRQHWTVPVSGPRFGGTKPIWVLTSSTTFSGAEELTYNLQQLGRAVVVGERTRGGAHPREGFTVHPHLEASVPIQRALNPISGTNWEGVGISPEVEVDAESAFAEAYRRALEHVIALPAAPGRREVTDEARAAAGLVAVAG
ncbi:S41 family peptidase [Kribbella sp. VKM Ac-2568]|uniref:S41 family peptidase n=1 Tax=Kribbella sp. VKM Ac-2568 TaxID=2512219 RepID=UPI001043CC57|nr:S41 family peptidase [Kribbella sp. VKM Ac-2568]TCM50370.1 peptidase S41-like protein [Kribbella sp. VKM Ac-2568]